MPSILVRGLDKNIIERLKERARRNGRSLQNEAKIVLQEAAEPAIEEFREQCRRLRTELAGREFPNSADLLREDRER